MPEKTKEYKVRKGYTIHRPPNHYHEGAIVELTEYEAKDKYSHQIEAIAVDSDKEIKDIVKDKAIKKDTVNKK